NRARLCCGFERGEDAAATETRNDAWVIEWDRNDCGFPHSGTTRHQRDIPLEQSINNRLDFVFSAENIRLRLVIIDAADRGIWIGRKIWKMVAERFAALRKCPQLWLRLTSFTWVSRLLSRTLRR